MTNEHGLEFEETDEDILGKSTPLIRAVRDAARELFKVKSDEDMEIFLGHWGHLFGAQSVNEGLDVGRLILALWAYEHADTIRSALSAGGVK